MSQATIVIPCFNLGEYLPDAVESARAQTVAPAEIIIVDDGSTDAKTVDVVERYRQAGIRVFRTANGGAPAARNIGIAAASSEHIVCLDADDVLLPSFLEETLPLLDAEPDVGVVTSYFERFGEANGIVKTRDYSPVTLLWRGGTIASCSLFRKRCWSDAGGWRVGLSGMQDREFWISIVERGWRWLVVHKPLYRYRKRADSISAHRVANKRALLQELVRLHPDTYLEHCADIILEMEAEIQRKHALHRETAKGKAAEISSLKRENALLRRKVRTFERANGSRPASPAGIGDLMMPEREVKRRELVQRIRGVAQSILPPTASVAVISRGDDDLLRLGGGRQGWHFPQTAEGVYAGYHPADSNDAVEHLERVRAKGAEFLLVPEPAYWWFEHYPGFQTYLEENSSRVVALENICTLFQLLDRGPVESAEEALRAAHAHAGSVDLSWMQPEPSSGGWTLAPDGLRFLASLIAQCRPRHVVEFGSGVSTRVLARACSESSSGCGVTSIDHDSEFMKIAERELAGAPGRCHVAFQTASLVLRRAFGRLVPIYRLNRKRFASELPADVIVIDGPPDRLGGREGTLYQALEFARPGTIVVLDDANREGESAILATWQQNLGTDIDVHLFPEYERGLAAIVVRSTRKRCGLSDVRAGRGSADAIPPSARAVVVA